MHPCYSNRRSVTFLLLVWQLWGGIVHERTPLPCSCKSDDTSEKAQMFALVWNYGFCPGYKSLHSFICVLSHGCSLLSISEGPHAGLYMPSTYHLNSVCCYKLRSHTTGQAPPRGGLLTRRSDRPGRLTRLLWTDDTLCVALRRSPKIICRSADPALRHALRSINGRRKKKRQLRWNGKDGEMRKQGENEESHKVFFLVRAVVVAALVSVPALSAVCSRFIEIRAVRRKVWGETRKIYGESLPSAAARTTSDNLHSGQSHTMIGEVVKNPLMCECAVKLAVAASFSLSPPPYHLTATSPADKRTEIRERRLLNTEPAVALSAA